MFSLKIDEYLMIVVGEVLLLPTPIGNIFTDSPRDSTFPFTSCTILPVYESLGRFQRPSGISSVFELYTDSAVSISLSRDRDGVYIIPERADASAEL